MVTAHGLPPHSGPLLLGMGYACAALALVMLLQPVSFLRRIEAGEVFCFHQCCGSAVHQLVLCWRSGFCLLAAGGSICRSLFLAVAAGFMALIVRVLKNAFAQAVRMKGRAGLRCKGASRCLLWSIWINRMARRHKGGG